MMYLSETPILCCLLLIESFIPLSFYYNMHNYRRYISYYVQVRTCTEKNYPGLREVLESAEVLQSQKNITLGHNQYARITNIEQRCQNQWWCNTIFVIIIISTKEGYEKIRCSVTTKNFP